MSDSLSVHAVNHAELPPFDIGSTELTPADIADDTKILLADVDVTLATDVELPSADVVNDTELQSDDGDYGVRRIF